MQKTVTLREYVEGWFKKREAASLVREIERYKRMGLVVPIENTRIIHPIRYPKERNEVIMHRINVGFYVIKTYLSNDISVTHIARYDVLVLGEVIDCFIFDEKTNKQYAKMVSAAMELILSESLGCSREELYQKLMQMVTRTEYAVITG